MSAEEIVARLGDLRREGLRRVEEASAATDLRELQVRLLGRKSELASVKSSLGALSPEARKEAGKALNEVTAELQGALERKLAGFEAQDTARRFEAERVDVTLPGRRGFSGRLHPLTTVMDEITDVLVGLGFAVAEGPEAESDYYNFQALNMPPDHPARSLWDTLYLEPTPAGQALLRTHTSPVQIRVMEKQSPPVYVIAPGRTFRRDVSDATHLPVFHQVEGLAVDDGISFADLKGTLEAFARAMFGPGQRVRTIPHYFPFTEPSADVSVSCFVCGGSGSVEEAGAVRPCRTCGAEGWIEIMGAGMVHPNVFRAAGYDPESTGFAFGMGVERIAMLRYGIPDIRWFYENDVRFLGAFA